MKIKRWSEMRKEEKGLVLGALLFILIIIVGSGGTPKETGTQQPAAQPEQQEETLSFEGKSAKKAFQILVEQKEKAEQVTKQATDLVTQDKMSEAKTLYENRWDELVKLRVEILYDKELTKEDKANIDNALKSEQEGITEILSTYEALYE